MSGHVLRIFDRLEAAENARRALLGAGLPGRCMTLAARADEAGALEGNFLVGNPKRGDAANGNHEDNFCHVVQGGIYLLTLTSDDNATCSLAASVMDGHGGRRVDDGLSAQPTDSA
ncbi:MAG: hypothetical protein JWQ72_2586 [Polaromonas sp.]|nr:hypothetical protein [Polaromonas sp.]